MAQAVSYGAITIVDTKDEIRQNFWALSTDVTEGGVTTPAGIYITQETSDNFKQNHSGPNIFMEAKDKGGIHSVGIKLRDGINELASFTDTGITLGKADGSQSHIKVDAYSIKAYDKENSLLEENPYFDIGDLRTITENGETFAVIKETFILDSDEQTKTETITLKGSGSSGDNVIGQYKITNEELVDFNAQDVNVVVTNIQRASVSKTITYDLELMEGSLDFSFSSGILSATNSPTDYIDSIVTQNGTTLIIDKDCSLEGDKINFDEEYDDTALDGIDIIINYSYYYCSDSHLSISSTIYSDNVEIDPEDYYIYNNTTILFAKDYSVPNSINFNYQIYTTKTQYPIKSDVSATLLDGTTSFTNFNIRNDKLGIELSEDFSDIEGLLLTYNTWGYDFGITIVKSIESESSDYEFINNVIIFKKVITSTDSFEITYTTGELNKFSLKFPIYTKDGNNYITASRNGTDLTIRSIQINNQDINIIFEESISAEDTIVIQYRSTSTNLKGYTLGYRKNNSIIGGFSTSIGYENEATENYSYAEGYKTLSKGTYGSHTEGRESSAIGSAAHAEGYLTQANGSYSHAEGYNTKAFGLVSHSEGYFSEGSGTYSHAQNLGTIANDEAMTAIGKYNAIDNKNRTLFVIGNGTSATARKNVFSVTKSANNDGNVWFNGNLYLENERHIWLKDTKGVYRHGIWMNSSNGITIGSSVNNLSLQSKNTSNKKGVVLTSGGYFYPGASIRLKNGFSLTGYKKNSTTKYYTIGYISTKNYAVIGSKEIPLVLQGSNRHKNKSYLLSSTGWLSLKGGIFVSENIHLPIGRAVVADVKVNKSITLIRSTSSNIILGNYNSGNPNYNIAIYGKNFYVSELGNITKVGNIASSGNITTSGTMKIDSATVTTYKHFDVDSSSDSVTISANSSSGNKDLTKEVAKTGYYPLGIVGINIAGTNHMHQNIYMCVLEDRTVGSATIHYRMMNNSSATFSGTVYFRVLWVQI